MGKGERGKSKPDDHRFGGGNNHNRNQSQEASELWWIRNAKKRGGWGSFGSEKSSRSQRSSEMVGKRSPFFSVNDRRCF